MASREPTPAPVANGGWTVREVLRGRAVLALLVAGVVLRLVYGAWAALPYRDGIIYDELARNLIAHGEYRASYPLLRPPGYPFFLAGVYAMFGEHHVAVRAVQALLDAVTALLVLAIAHRLGVSRRAATLATALALFNPSTFLYSAMILSESLATFLVTAGTWLLHALTAGARWALGFGAALSAAALTRPSFALLPGFLLVVLLLAWPLAWRRWIRVAVLAGAAFVLVWLPWGVRNALHYHALVPYHRYVSTESGYHLWVTTWALTLRDEYAAYIDVSVPLPPRAYATEAERAALEPLVAQRRFHEWNDRFREVALSRIAARPIDYYLVKPLVRCVTMWLSPPTTLLAQANVRLDRLAHDVVARPLAVLAKGALTVVTVAFALLVAVGWWHVRRRQGSIADLPVAVAVYATVIIQVVMVARPELVVMNEPRYLVESFPALAPLVAASLLSMLAGRRAGERRETTAAIQRGLGSREEGRA